MNGWFQLDGMTAWAVGGLLVGAVVLGSCLALVTGCGAGIESEPPTPDAGTDARDPLHDVPPGCTHVGFLCGDAAAFPTTWTCPIGEPPPEPACGPFDMINSPGVWCCP